MDNWKEKLGLYENENALLRKQLQENTKTSEIETQKFKKKLMEEIKEINQKELNFKIIQQNLEETLHKITKEKNTVEKKFGEISVNFGKIQCENEELLMKLKESNQENVGLKRQIALQEKIIKEKTQVLSILSIIIYLGFIRKMKGETQKKIRILEKKIRSFKKELQK